MLKVLRDGTRNRVSKGKRSFKIIEVSWNNDLPKCYRTKKTNSKNSSPIKENYWSKKLGSKTKIGSSSYKIRWRLSSPINKGLMNRGITNKVRLKRGRIKFCLMMKDAKWRTTLSCVRSWWKIVQENSIGKQMNDSLSKKIRGNVKLMKI